MTHWLAASDVYNQCFLTFGFQMLFLKLVGRLPFCLIYPLAWLLYLLVCYVVGYRKAVVAKNIRQAFPELSDEEVWGLSKKFYKHFAQLFLELVKAHSMRVSDFKKRCTVVGQAALMQETNNGTRPAIILTVHQGNWEWMLHGAALHLGIPIDPVYKPLHHAGMNQFIHEVRSRFYSTPIPMKSAGINILRQKHFRLFVMLADQRPGKHEQNYRAAFLNKKADFFIGAEKIARITQYPIFYAKCKKMKAGYYELEFIQLAKPPYERCSDNNHYPIIDAYINAAELSISEQPETYLWSHQRWK